MDNMDMLSILSILSVVALNCQARCSCISAAACQLSGLATVHTATTGTPHCQFGLLVCIS